MEVKATIDKKRRMAIARNHTRFFGGA